MTKHDCTCSCWDRELPIKLKEGGVCECWCHEICENPICLCGAPKKHMQLQHCDVCNQMTNHREGKCLKHEKGKESLNVSNWEKDLSQLKTIHDLERIGHTEEKLQVKAFIQAVEKEAYQRGTQDERQFILNILDGIDIANKEMGHPPDTKAIRFALKSRLI